MNKIFIVFLLSFSFFLNSCTVYTEKQSEAISQTVYATKDSLDNARFDLADQFSTLSTRLVKPPKKRVVIEPIYKKNIDVIASQSKKSPVIIDKQRVLIIPEKFKNDTVVVVSSAEYEQLLKDKDIFAQIEKDNENLIETRKIVDEELIRQMEYSDKMVKDLNIMQRKLLEKDLAILQRNITIFILLAFIGIAGYLRIKGVL
jgi:hypothetical protein